MYLLVNTFTNDDVISRHRSLVAAVCADRKLQKQVKKANGSSSYLPTVIRNDDGTPVSPEDFDDVFWQLEND